ncbi:filamentous hemagglutinin N-terminal domain-containing protein [Phormidium tenue FACHB-886]|nr:filamentous hemagglutinin N-terminal domain-containing protein [Phormidium tenue FACHB-886]
MKIQSEIQRFSDRLYLFSSLIGCFLVLGSSQGLAQIVPDRTTDTRIQGGSETCARGCTIEGGTRSPNNRNLFHSFRSFNVPAESTVQFIDSGVRNVLIRVTGQSASQIDGQLAVDGAANLFLLNPNGILFGNNASLDVNGSFAASTADAIQFGQQGEFSAVDPTAPALLTVEPSAFLFNRGAHGQIENRSMFQEDRRSAGLRVPANRSLLLVGGDVTINGGKVNSAGSRVEVGGLTGAGAVKLQNWQLNFPETGRAAVSLENGGLISVERGELVVTARSLSLVNSRLEALGINGSTSGTIALDLSDQLSLTEASITTQTYGSGNAGQIVIAADAIDLHNSSISTSTLGQGQGGNILITARTLQLNGTDTSTSTIEAQTSDSSNAGNITIEATDTISINNGSTIATGSSFGIVALGDSGNITLRTDQLSLADGGRVTTNGESTVVSRNARGGDLEITARSVQLTGGSRLSATSATASGGNIRLNGANWLSLDGGSEISASAGTAQQAGNGGNITLNAQFIVADPFSNSNITANAYAGNGGRVDLYSNQIFGIQYRQSDTPLSDITVSSEFGNSGVVRINDLEADPSRGLTPLPTTPTDATTQIARTCSTSTVASSFNQFVITGRGGLPPNPTEAIASSGTLVGWARLEGAEERGNQGAELGRSPNVRPAAPTLVEAQGWVVDVDGQVSLAATPPIAPAAADGNSILSGRLNQRCGHG